MIYISSQWLLLILCYTTLHKRKLEGFFMVDVVSQQGFYTGLLAKKLGTASYYDR